MNFADELAMVYNRATQGDESAFTFDLYNRMSKAAVSYINAPNNWSRDDRIIVKYLLEISDILYNNSSLNILPLDDGVYDQLLAIFKDYEDEYIYYTPGAPNVKFKEAVENEIDHGPKLMFRTVSDDDLDKYLYSKDIMEQYTPVDPRLRTMFTVVREPISKRLVTATHNYPELVGTLDKCKFVLNAEARDKGVFDTPSVKVFERDFIHKHLDMGIIKPNEEFEMIAELKYDGVSVEASVQNGRIISAFSRGDTAENLATDLTPIFGGYTFRNAGMPDIADDLIFGMKFEAIITKYDMQRLAERRGKSYKNCRNAIIGLLGSSDAYRYRDLITLIPLSTSLDIPRVTEIQFINKYYSSGQYNRYAVLRGNYIDILFQVDQFAKSAEMIRPVMPYLYDGIVVSYIDEDKINALGRVNSVNKYSMAIKFNPRKVRTIFLGYTFTVGKAGNITPMAHFKECEFMGTIHDMQTVHSYKRFKELDLKLQDEIDVEYRNDVICYITKPDTEANRSNKNPVWEFPKICPVCGHELKLSDSEDSVICPNIQCDGRAIRRMTDMLDRLGFNGFSEATVKSIGVKSLCGLVNLYPDETVILGPTNQAKLHDYIKRLLMDPIKDYTIMSAIGFENIGDETWKLILHEYSLTELCDLHYCQDELMDALIAIKGIGKTTAETICYYMDLYHNDIEFINSMDNVISTKGDVANPKIAITGFRNQEFIDILNDNGYDASDKYGVSKKISYLIAADPNEKSSKIEKAKALGIPILTRTEMLERIGYNV